MTTASGSTSNSSADDCSRRSTCGRSGTSRRGCATSRGRLFDDDEVEVETKHAIESLDGIDEHAEAVRGAVARSVA